MSSVKPAPGSAAWEEAAYERFHRKRYALVLELLARHVHKDCRVLDIGRSTLTDQLHERFRVPVDSLGFLPEGQTSTGWHYHFDLNDAQHRERWRADLPRYDALVFAEVIEHLYTSPMHVLSFLRTLLRPGGVLLVQTPNAVALTKRVKLLIGRHPYDQIREDNTNPGHFREYSGPELRAYATATGFDILHFGYYNYFDLRETEHTKSTTPRWIIAARYHLTALLPAFLKPGMTTILSRSDNASFRAHPSEHGA